MHSSSRGFRPLPIGALASPHRAAATDEVDIVAMARESRRSAEAFAAAVQRYGEEMPDALDRFHEAMTAFRDTANRLRKGLPVGDT